MRGSPGLEEQSEGAQQHSWVLPCTYGLPELARWPRGGSLSHPDLSFLLYIHTSCQQTLVCPSSAWKQEVDNEQGKTFLLRGSIIYLKAMIVFYKSVFIEHLQMLG